MMRAALGYSKAGKLGWCAESAYTFPTPEAAADALAKRKELAETNGEITATFFEDGCVPHVGAAPVIAKCVSDFPPGGPKRGTIEHTYLDPEFLLGAKAMKECFAAKGAWTDTIGLAGVEHLRQLACAKDVKGFFTLVDREKMIDSLMRGRPAGVRPIAAQAWDESVTEWSKDIDRGDKGFVCGWEIEGVTPSGVIGVKLVSGKHARIGMEKRGDAWMMVAFESK